MISTEPKKNNVEYSSGFHLFENVEESRLFCPSGGTVYSLESLQWHQKH